ncbi:MAG: class I SAM-dependent methyltransferase [Anderseniella sp.]
MTSTDYTADMTKPSSRFWDKIADRYARQPVKDETAYQEKLQLTQSYLRPDMKLLEFGCGTGTTALKHAPFVDRILATDISARMLEIAEQKAEAAGIGNVVFERAAIDDFTVPDNSFDVVLGMSILHLLADKDMVIAKVHNMLKPGGIFVSSTVCLGNTMSFFKLIGPLGHALGVLPLLKVFTTQELVDNIRARGFDIEHEWSPGKGTSVFIVARKPA